MPPSMAEPDGKGARAAVIRVKDNEALADLVTKRMLAVAGITKSNTQVAFRVHSRHHLEAMFAIGES